MDWFLKSNNQGEGRLSKQNCGRNLNVAVRMIGNRCHQSGQKVMKPPKSDVRFKVNELHLVEDL